MKPHRLGLIALFLLAACAQERLDLQEDQVFSNRFSPDSLALTEDDGSEVRVRPGTPGQGGRGFIGYGGGGADSFLWPFLNYSNWVHNWYPALNRTINVEFGRDYGVGAAFDPFAVAISSVQSCFNLQITSNRRLRVLQHSTGGYVAGSGGNSITVSAQVQNRGRVILAVEDNYGGNCGQQPFIPWWEYGFHPTNCGAPTSYVTVRITGSGGSCGAPQAVNVDLSPYVNQNWGGFGGLYSVPFFRFPLSGGFVITGRAMEYPGQLGHNWWGF